jgi:pimeloyl-ACP methyl ester carboxylesterase
VDAPQVHYAKSGEVHIAYQVIGSGAVDLVFIPGLFSNLDHNWEEPGFAEFLRRLAAFSRLIVVDPRGTGLSDRAQRHPPMEEQVDDMLSVLDSAASRSAAFFGFSQGGPIALLFAATHPERTRALVLYATYATPVWHEDYPWGRSAEWLDEFDRRIEREWGTGFFLPQIAPSRVDDSSFRTWWARMERLSCGPGNAQAYYRVYSRIDLRSILPSIRVPTLVLQRDADVFRHPGHSQYLADRIPGARLVGLSGVDHLPYVGDADAILQEVQEFLTGVRTFPEHDRVLATVLFTDIVSGSAAGGVGGVVLAIGQRAQDVRSLRGRGPHRGGNGHSSQGGRRGCSRQHGPDPPGGSGRLQGPRLARGRAGTNRCDPMPAGELGCRLDPDTG